MEIKRRGEKNVKYEVCFTIRTMLIQLKIDYLLTALPNL